MRRADSRAFFFRHSEMVGPQIKAGRQTYEAWAASFSRLSGIMGKRLDEEVPGRSATGPPSAQTMASS